MRRTALISAALALALPGLAQAKTGVVFDKAPDRAVPGEKINFTVIAMREPPGPGPHEAHPVAGAHALVTFRSESGRVVRVRSTETDLNGIGYGSIRFPDKGPWTTEMTAGPARSPGEFSEPVEIGSALPRPAPAAAAPSSSAEFPWVWAVLLGLAGTGLAVAVTQRRRFGGAA